MAPRGLLIMISNYQINFSDLFFRLNPESRKTQRTPLVVNDAIQSTAYIQTRTPSLQPRPKRAIYVYLLGGRAEPAWHVERQRNVLRLPSCSPRGRELC